MDDKDKLNCQPEKLKSNFFVQYACVYPSSQDITRQIYGLIISCLGVFIYCFTIVYFDYIRAIEKNKYVDFDVQTITASDYTIEFDLKESSYQTFKSVYYDKSNPMSEIAQFRFYIQKELEDRISEFPDMGFDEQAFIDPDATVVNQSTLNKSKKKQKTDKSMLNQTQGPKRISIAQITFAFFNAEVIGLLRKRGGFIGTEKWDKLKEVNQEINEIIKKKEILDKLQTPCSVFATFETEEGYQRAKLYNKLIKESVDNFEQIQQA